MKADLIDFGPVQVLQPTEPLSPAQWVGVRLALGLAAIGAKQAAEAMLGAAGLTSWPPKKLRTTLAWTEAQKAFVLANGGQIDAYALARTVSTMGPERSATAVEKFLRDQGRKAVLPRVRGANRHRHDDGAVCSGFVPQDDRAHVAAVLSARPSGYRWAA